MSINNNNTTFNNLETELREVEAQRELLQNAADAAAAQAEQLEYRAGTIREAIARDQAERRTSTATSYTVTLPNGSQITLVSQSDSRLDQPMPAGATLQPKSTATAGGR